MTPRILVLRAAGINCDLETAFAFERFGAKADRHHVNRLLERSVSLSDYDGLVIPGGFSYGDDIAGGKVLAIELLHHLSEPILALVDRGGIVLGICNGFQVLVKMGILPGVAARIGRQEATLTDNESNRYEDRWVHLEAVADRSVYCKKSERLHVPVAHGEGRYLARDESVHRAIVAGGHVAFRYVAEDGSEPTYPENPNGSVDHVAGLVDQTGRVLGLMPHPERAMFAVHHPDPAARGVATAQDEGDGAILFKNVVEYLRG